MDLSVHYAFVPHVDPDASLRFYRDVLGLEVRMDVGGGTMRWITVGPPGGEGTAIVIQPPLPDPSTTDEERRVVAELMAKGTYAMLTLGTDDLDGLFERMVAHDVDVVSEPADQPYGVRDCAVRDPAGTLIRINQT
ncbi:MAG: glyoxalase [Nocardioides sp.]|nr:glyoxalase [Nocardioides sp.]